MAGLVLRLCRAGGPWVRYVFFASSYNVVSLRRRTTPVPGSRVTAANDRAATRGHSCASAGGLPRRRQRWPWRRSAACSTGKCLSDDAQWPPPCAQGTPSRSQTTAPSPTTFFFLPGRPSISGPCASSVPAQRPVCGGALRPVGLSGEAQPNRCGKTHTATTTCQCPVSCGRRVAV